MENNFSIPYVNFKAQYEAEKEAIHSIVEEVFSSGDFINGRYVEKLEMALAEFLNVSEVVTLNSGTDALIYGMRALGLGQEDEIITPPNSFIASTSAIIQVGATPRFVDVLPDQNIDPAKIEAAITAKTKAIMIVHLSGRMCEMNQIMEIAKKHQLLVIEDAAQAIGSQYQQKMAGSFGEIGCFSAHPLKNLNAAGDAGFLTTNDSKAAEFLRQYRAHGHIDRNTALNWGCVSRLDTLQAGLLLFRLKQLPALIAKRQKLAALYQQQLSQIDELYFPVCSAEKFNTFHTFVIQVANRDALQKYLFENNIHTAIHYPTPIHLQPAAKNLGCQVGDFPVAEAQAKRIISLPINQYLTEENITQVCEQITKFYQQKVKKQRVCPAPEATKTFLVTGGCGFIGSHLTESLLKENHRVIIIDNLSGGTLENIASFKTNPRLTVIHADISQDNIAPYFKAVDGVFHLAALADIVPSITHPEHYFQTNVAGTFKVMQLAHQYKVKKVVYAASASCYGIADVYPTTENCDKKPLYPYALTKMMGEELALHWGQVYQIPVLSLRLFNVYGPRSRTNGTYGAMFGVFLAQLLAGKPLTIVGDGEQVRDFTYVSDVVNAFILAMDSPIADKILNVGSGKPISVNYIAKLLNSENNLVHIPKRPGEPDKTYADIRRIQQLLNWTPTISIEAGVKLLLEHLNYWEKALVWTPETIQQATADWFKYLGEKENERTN